MEKHFPAKVILKVLLFGGLVNPLQTFAETRLAPGVHVDVLVAPSPVKANGRANLLYELHITNFREDNLELVRVDVLADETTTRPLASYTDPELTTRLARPGLPADTSSKRIIGPGLRAIVFIDVSVDSTAVPVSLHHRLFFKPEKPEDESGEMILEGPRAVVSREHPLVISAPLRGGGWAAVNSLGSKSHHRQSVFPFYGKARVPQRYAIDWIMLGENGKPFHDDPRANANWFGYGVEVLAVADATITEVKDGMPENAPLSEKPSLPFEANCGNYVILDLGRGYFALYAHLQPGSIKVKVGQRVRQGQVLGLLGNSGNSPVPHLHFHIIDANSPFFGEGLPYVFKSFIVQGSAESFDAMMTRGFKKQPTEKPDKRLKELPINYAVVSFL